MKRPMHMRAQLGSLMKSCAEVAEKAGVEVVRGVARRMESARQDERGRKVMDSIAQGTERLIAKSPVPIPGVVQDALERMREALGQLSQSIDTVNAGASSLARDQPGQDPSRRQAMDDARAAFVDLEANDEAGSDADAKKPRRHRSRRSSHHRQADDTQSTQSAKKDRADRTPNS